MNSDDRIALNAIITKLAKLESMVGDPAAWFDANAKLEAEGGDPNVCIDDQLGEVSLDLAMLAAHVRGKFDAYEKIFREMRVILGAQANRLQSLEDGVSNVCEDCGGPLGEVH